MDEPELELNLSGSEEHSGVRAGECVRKFVSIPGSG